MDWVVYILKCNDQTLYTGSSNNVVLRFQKHCLGKGAKYTKGRAPFSLVYLEECFSHGEALKRECFIKQQSRKKKWELILQNETRSQQLWKAAKMQAKQVFP